MLTSELIKPRLRFSGSTVSIEMVDEQDEALQQTAQELIDLLRSHVNRTQEEWEKAVTQYEGARIDYVFVRGLAKVLTDAATFSPLTTPLPPAVLRERAFAWGPVFKQPDMFHSRSRQDVLQELAGEFALAPAQLDGMLFADRHASYLLTDAGPAWIPATLLARYNLELARGVLYWASHLTIEASSNYKDLWKYIKFFKLMFWAEQKPGGGYRIDLDGPISPFVSATLRYGRQMAAFLPALLLCDRWQMLAHVHPPQAREALTYRLDYTSALCSHFKRSGVFDSRLEADFASDFEQKIGNKRGHWRLERESEVLLLGDMVMIPDFTFIDDQDENRRVIVELVGFWHPQYLRRKLEKVRLANCAHMLLLVYKGLNVTEEAFQEAASEVIFFQQKPVLKEVMEAVETIAERVYGPRPKRKRTRKA
jgi:predicted nuclease of restriction endonuclease-like RecB superfamily